MKHECFGEIKVLDGFVKQKRGAASVYCGNELFEYDIVYKGSVFEIVGSNGFKLSSIARRATLLEKLHIVSRLSCVDESGQEVVGIDEFAFEKNGRVLDYKKEYRESGHPSYLFEGFEIEFIGFIAVKILSSKACLPICLCIAAYLGDWYSRSS